MKGLIFMKQNKNTQYNTAKGVAEMSYYIMPKVSIQKAFRCSLLKYTGFNPFTPVQNFNQNMVRLPGVKGDLRLLVNVL